MLKQKKGNCLFDTMIERVSIECRKTKTKVITFKKDGDNPVNQSKLEVITRSRHKARENVLARATIGFVIDFEPITKSSNAKPKQFANWPKKLL